MKTLTIKRLAIYLIVFFVSVLLIFGLTNFSQQMDTFLVEQANQVDNSKNLLSENLKVIHIEMQNTAGATEKVKQFRNKIINFLATISNEYDKGNKVEGIVLDISFSEESVELPRLKAILKELKDKGVKVYAAYNINEKETIEANDHNHALEIYNEYLEGSGEAYNYGSGRYHTKVYTTNGGLVTYEPEMFLKSVFGDTVIIESLVKKVAHGLSKNKELLKEKTNREGYVIPLGSDQEIKSVTYDFITDTTSNSGRFESNTGNGKPLEIDDNILVVGDIINDKIRDGTPGPYVVTWALNDLLNLNQGGKQPLEGNFIRVGQALFFAFLTVLIFAFLFQYLKRMQTQPKALGLLSFVIGLLFLSLFGVLVLSFNTVIPIGLTVIAMAIAAALSWRFANKYLSTGVAEGSEKYDVFISYSHGNSDWVLKNVYEPLKGLRKQNGDKLNIFFDKDDIGVGEAFTAKYMWAIVDSRFFVPVMSEEYYGKNHCKNEMDLAYKRSVEKKITILPIAFTYDCVPEIYSHINFSDVSVNGEFINGISQELLK